MIIGSTDDNLHSVRGLFTQGTCSPYAYLRVRKNTQITQSSIGYQFYINHDLSQAPDAPVGGRASALPVLIARGPGFLLGSNFTNKRHKSSGIRVLN